MKDFGDEDDAAHEYNDDEEEDEDEDGDDDHDDHGGVDGDVESSAEVGCIYWRQGKKKLQNRVVFIGYKERQPVSLERDETPPSPDKSV